MLKTSVAAATTTAGAVFEILKRENWSQFFFGDLLAIFPASARDLRIALAKLEGENLIRYSLSPCDSVPNNEGVDPRAYYTLV